MTTQLTTIPPGFWNTVNVTSMTDCFSQCTSLKSVDYEELARIIRLKDRRLKIEKLRTRNGL